MANDGFFKLLSIAVTGAVVVVGVPLTAEAATSLQPAARSSISNSFVPPDDAASSRVPAPGAPTTPWAPQANTRLQSSGGSANRAPAGTPVGAPGLGALPYFAFEKIELSTNVVAQVNLGNGNLVLTGNDGVLTGPGLGARNDRYYNGLSTQAGSFGGGWSAALSSIDVGVKLDATSATFQGPNGFSSRFIKSGSSYTTPAGFNATLITGPGGSESYVMTYNQTGERFTFNASGYITGDRNRNGVGNTFTYNEFGQVRRVLEASGRFFEINWVSNTSSLISSISDSAGRTVTYSRNAANQLTRLDAPEGRWEEYDYDTSGRISQARFVGSGTTPTKVDFTYDTSSRLTSIKQGIVGSATYLATSGIPYATGQTTVTDPRGKNAIYFLDAQGRVTSAKDALNQTRANTWTANSDVDTATDALAGGGTPGNVTTTTYDALNNATSTALPTGAAAGALYATGVNCPGIGGTTYQPKCSKDAAGAGKAFDYDAAGNLLRVTDSTAGGTGSTPQQFTYQGGTVNCGAFAGQVCSSKDGKGNTTTYAYDADGNVITVTPPAPLGDVTYVYDSLGRVTQVTDGNNEPTTFLYNARDEVTRSTYSGGAIVNTTWLANGVIGNINDSIAGTKTFTYDGLSRILQEVGPGIGSETYTYDPNGNTLTYQDGGGTVSYLYDDANQLIRSIEPAGSCQTTTGSASDSGCIKYEYSTNGTETKRTLPGNATITRTVDLSGRPVRITGKNGAGAVVSDVGYSYSAAGATGPSADREAVQSRTSYVEVGVAPGAITTYQHDSLGRLTSAIEKSGTTVTASWTYAYDAVGNRTQQIRIGNTGTGTAPGTTTYTYNAANQLASTSADSATWAYDGAGNQTRNGITGQSATFNSRLAATGIASVTFTNFGQGNTERLSRSASTTSYSSSAFGLSRELLDGSAQRNYTRTSEGDAVSTRFGGGSKFYYVQDGAGSVIGLFDKTGAFAGGYSYSPYGEQRNTVATGSGPDSNSLRYISGYADRSVSGLYKLGARYYDPTIGRFTQPDPTGQESNSYSYAGANPTTNIDPSGEAFFIPFLVAGAVRLAASAATRFAATNTARAVGGRLATSARVGEGSKLFGNGSLAPAYRSGALNPPGRVGARLGWSVRPTGTSAKGMETIFRGRTPGGTKIDLFPGRTLSD